MNRILLLLLALSGCAGIDYQRGPVPGLEHMTVEEHRVEAREIYQKCTRCGHAGAQLPIACTCINFRTKHAVIWLVQGASRATIEHERAHARGYDHTSGELHSQYAAWARSVRNAAAPPSAAAAHAEAGAGKLELSELKSDATAE